MSLTDIVECFFVLQYATEFIRFSFNLLVLTKKKKQVSSTHNRGLVQSE